MKKYIAHTLFSKKIDFFKFRNHTDVSAVWTRWRLNNIVPAWMKFPMDWLFKDTKRNHSFPHESIKCFDAMETQFKDFFYWTEDVEKKSTQSSLPVHTPDSRLSHSNNRLYLSFYQWVPHCIRKSSTIQWYPLLLPFRSKRTKRTWDGWEWNRSSLASLFGGPHSIDTYICYIVTLMWKPCYTSPYSHMWIPYEVLVDSWIYHILCY